MRLLNIIFINLTFMLVFFSNSNGQTYRVLVSNDDGIESPMLHILYDEINAMPNVEAVVSAPRYEQSSTSHSFDRRTIRVTERFYKDSIFFGYGVHGTPAMAVRFGIRVLGKDVPFDLVVSGINQGSNVGDISHISGTVGAAMEGVYNGLPAIAVSQDTRNANAQLSAKIVTQLVAKFQKEEAPKGVVISINVPGGEVKGVVARPMGGSFFQTEYPIIEEKNDSIIYELKWNFYQSTDSKKDTYAYQQGYVTITPLKFDWTDYALLDELNSWDLKLIEK